VSARSFTPDVDEAIAGAEFLPVVAEPEETIRAHVNADSGKEHLRLFIGYLAKDDLDGAVENLVTAASTLPEAAAWLDCLDNEGEG